MRQARMSAAVQPLFEALEPRLLLDALQPDLLASGDSGVASDDNITNVTTPTIQVETTEPAVGVAVYRDGTRMGYASFVSGNTWAYTFTEGQMLEGNNALTARTFDGEDWSADSPALTVILDTTAPTVLLPLGIYDTGNAYDVQVVGTLAYVPDWSDGLRIIDVSDPSAPMQVGSYNTPGKGMDVEVVGTLAYVADYDEGLRILNISTPSSPTSVGSWKLDSYAYGVTVSGSLAYVAHVSSGVRIVDVSTPSAPKYIGRMNLSDSFAVHVVGSLAYVADGTSGLRIVDVSTPASPTVLGSYNTPGRAFDVQVVDGLAYLADGTGGLQIIDVSDPAVPVLRGSYATSDARSVCVVGSLIYVADSGALRVFDISNPATPAPTGSATAGSGTGVDVVGSIVYMSVGHSGLQTFSVGGPVIDLQSDSDTGDDDADNVTGDTTPTFDVDGIQEFVRIYRDGALVSGAYETAPLRLSTQPAGTYSYTARAVDAAGNESVDSEALAVTFVCLPCDSNQDMKVDGGDLSAWQANYDPLGVNENTYAKGDWNGDGFIDGGDLALWQQNYNPLGVTAESATAESVAADPSEPAGGMELLLARSVPATGPIVSESNAGSRAPARVLSVTSALEVSMVESAPETVSAPGPRRVGVTTSSITPLPPGQSIEDILALAALTEPLE